MWFRTPSLTNDGEPATAGPRRATLVGLGGYSNLPPDRLVSSSGLPTPDCAKPVCRRRSDCPNAVGGRPQTGSGQKPQRPEAPAEGPPALVSKEACDHCGPCGRTLRPLATEQARRARERRRAALVLAGQAEELDAAVVDARRVQVDADAVAQAPSVVHGAHCRRLCPHAALMFAPLSLTFLKMKSSWFVLLGAMASR